MTTQNLNPWPKDTQSELEEAIERDQLWRGDDEDEYNEDLDKENDWGFKDDDGVNLEDYL